MLHLPSTEDGEHIRCFAQKEADAPEVIGDTDFLCNLLEHYEASYSLALQKFSPRIGHLSEMVNCSLDPPIHPTVFIPSITGIYSILSHGIVRLQQFFLVMPSVN